MMPSQNIEVSSWNRPVNDKLTRTEHMQSLHILISKHQTFDVHLCTV